MDTAITLRNIGNIYYFQGYEAEALEYFERCLKIQ